MPEYTLLDPAVSVHVSCTKARFATFRRATKGQGLLSANNNIIPMEGLREVSMPFRVGSQLKIVILKKSRFDLEVSIEPGLDSLLGWIKGYIWTHRSDEIGEPLGSWASRRGKAIFMRSAKQEKAWERHLQLQPQTQNLALVSKLVRSRTYLQNARTVIKSYMWLQLLISGITERVMLDR